MLRRIWEISPSWQYFTIRFHPTPYSPNTTNTLVSRINPRCTIINSSGRIKSSSAARLFEWIPVELYDGKVGYVPVQTNEPCFYHPMELIIASHSSLNFSGGSGGVGGQSKPTDYKTEQNEGGLENFVAQVLVHYYDIRLYYIFSQGKGVPPSLPKHLPNNNNNNLHPHNPIPKRNPIPSHPSIPTSHNLPPRIRRLQPGQPGLHNRLFPAHIQLWVTFSHADTYALRTAECGGVYTVRGSPVTATATAGVQYVEAVITKYAISYRDYVDARYSRVRVERCVEEEEEEEEECEVWYERWVEQVFEEEEVIVIVPVTVNTYCPEPTTITYAGTTVTVLAADVPTTVVFVTESKVTVTSTVTRVGTTTATATTTEYTTPGYSPSSSSSYKHPPSPPPSSSTRHFASTPHYPATTPYPRPSPIAYPPQQSEECEEEDKDLESHSYGRFSDNEGMHAWGRIYDSTVSKELRKRQSWGEYQDNEEAHNYGEYAEYGRQRGQKVHWGGRKDGGGRRGHRYDDKAVDSYE
ncbi:hypothetical protein L873DRAFT_1894064 [Choiromyces venosus 120613-1]|uniref:Uncharacterized protein n=1 Tax=Choiromyces venosus 120613-1 TaxID=1336337 RepID=A0A3N4JRT2_9PEZI|nr:hypothetical protein L873DRAFT_1894064 [Choiromyces venosus 120613-1]